MRVRSLTHGLENGLRKKKFVNRFPFFSEGFSSQLQIISIDFYFTAKQTPANDENALQKMFYVKTNRALI